MPFFTTWVNLEQSARFHLYYEALILWAHLWMLCVCVLLCSSAQIHERYGTISSLTPQKLRVFMTQRKCSLGTETRRTPAFLSVTLTLWTFFNNVTLKKKHREELIRPNHSTITEQVHHLGWELCWKRRHVQYFLRVSPCAAQQLILKFVFYLT